jgi:hypothetical protein
MARHKVTRITTTGITRIRALAPGVMENLDGGLERMVGQVKTEVQLLE